MIDMRKIIKVDTLLTVIMAGLTVIILGYINLRSGIPLSGFNRIIRIILFPLSMIVFHLFTVYGTEQKKAAGKFDQWSGLWVFPFLITALLWQYWESWQTVSAIVFALYIFSRLIGFIYFRQEKIKTVDVVDLACVFSGLFFLNVYNYTGPGETSIFQTIAGAVLVTVAGYLSVLAIETYAGRTFAGTMWQRSLMLLICLIMPFSGMMTCIDLNIIPVLGLLIYMSLRTKTSAVAHLVSLIGAGVVVGVSPVINPGLIPLSIWMTLLISISENKGQKKKPDILINSIYILLLVAGI